MVAVTVNRGMPRPEAPAASLPKDQWDDLVIVRKLWAQSQLPFDCRMLKLVASDAPVMATELGYGTEEAFLREGLQLDPELVSRVVDWLDQEKPQRAVTLAHVQKQLKSHGGDRKSGKAKEHQDYHGNVDQQGNSSEYRIARLKRDAPEIAIALARGEYPSVRAAAMAAGFVTPPPPSLQLKEPVPTAQKLLAKKGKEWCLQLLDELSALVFED
jgi:hypothetical protein